MNMVKVGNEVLIVGKVQNCGLRKTKKRNFYQVTLKDGHGSVNLIWFHALSWITGKFEIGDIIAAYGKVDFFNGFMTGGSINTKKYMGMSFGILLIPYQTKQYSGITCQLGYSHSFGFGSGFDLGIGYRI